MDITTETLENGWIEYTLKNDNGMQVKILNYGGIITEILVPDKDGKLENVVLSYDQMSDYEENPFYLGAVIGRVAGRIANSSFILHGETIQLPADENGHHLHGGTNGFHNHLWESTAIDTGSSVNVNLQQTRLASVDGYPGDLSLFVTYALTNDNQLRILYEGLSTEDTVLSMTNHSYFNLSGNGKRLIHDHEVTMPASRIIELDAELLPTGNALDVTGTAFDFRDGQPLSTGIASEHPQNIIASNGYDHYFIFDDQTPVKVCEKESGRTMEIRTNQPGMVMYTGNGFPEDTNFATDLQGPYSGVAFETQAPPASLQFPDDFPTVYLHGNRPYKKLTVFTFGVEA